jgi:hypothetical protein
MHLRARKEATMSLCPECGRAFCDHTAQERGQTDAEMMRPLNDEESQAFSQIGIGSDTTKILVAQKNAHLPAKQ